MAGAVRQEGHGAGNGDFVSLLSLKLILLAFFILLNALSEFEDDRTRAVIQSVHRSFKDKIDSPESTVAYSTSLGQLPETKALIGEVGSLFEAEFPAVRSKEERRATVLRIELPADSLFEPGGAGLRAGRKRLVRRLAKALMRDRGGGPAYELDVLHGVPPGAAGKPATAGASSLEVRRAGLLARRLTGAGLPPEALSTGVDPARPGVVQLILRVREETETPADLQESAE
ncbi:MAG: hypothetical protein ACE5KF_08680 [Kiloniellaceae bacterium]